jgi:dTDP-4-amino-4,6-dideoxygalactose transaminase
LNYDTEDFPVAARVATEIVSLPMFPQLAVDQQTRVAEEIRRFTSKTSHERKQVEEDSLSQEERVA